MKKNQFTSIDNVQMLSRDQMRMIVAGKAVSAAGTPGGNNSNPCPTYREPAGGTIMYVGTINGVVYTCSKILCD